MLLPKEKPFLSDLNSYYLQIDKFIEHLQGEIGSGCIYCKSADQELLVYFDESEIVRGVTQNDGEHARVSQSIDPVLGILLEKSFLVTVYYLDASSIFFWGQMPAFKRAKSTLSSSKITLPDLIFRLSQKLFSGFIDIEIEDRGDCAILFFYEGQRRGGSYSWGEGGLSPADDDYNRLLGILQTNTATYKIGHFTTDLTAAPEQTVAVASDTPADNEQEDKQVDEPANETESTEYFSDLNSAINEFMGFFVQVVGKKIKTDPLIELKLKFIDYIGEYPILDPYNNYYDLADDGAVTFADQAPENDIASGLVDCSWMVVEDYKLQKRFRALLKKWSYKTALLERGINVER